MPISINVLTGKNDLHELPLEILDEPPTQLANGQVVIVKVGAEKWLYWETEGNIYKAQGVLV